MGSRKSIIREAIERLDSLMAIGTSRFQAKQAQRAASPDVGWTVSTGRIHSHTTRKVYQQHILAFINWARTQHGITRLAWLEERADELVTDDVLREALGKTPDGDYIDYYAQVKRDEFRTWHSGVSDWEVERYLTLF